MSSNGLGDVGRRYRLLRLIGQGGMGRVYAALDRLTGRQVALKQVALPLPRVSAADARLTAADTVLALGPTDPAPDAHPSAATTRRALPLPGAASRPSSPDSDGLRLRLAHEFRTLAAMRHPHIVSVLDYGFDEQRRPYYTMELLVDAAPLLRTAENWQLDTLLELVAQLLRALCYLHRRGVLHRDLKPANLLVLDGPAGPTLKVLDFGLALAREQAGRALGEISGTLGYLAPEVLMGAVPSEAADLYAAGAVAYQLLTGQAAFAAYNDDAVLADTLAGRVDLGLLQPLGQIGEVIARLLAVAPEDRFASAADALAALAVASGRPLLDEDSALRDSFLHTARFVGRERESEILRAALTAAVRGQGATWLVGGQSGIGKSRLLDELRTVALVQGVLTARGQSVTTASRPYRVFQDALRLLCLHVELTEPEAAVLGVIFPDLDPLRERVFAEAPVLDTPGAELRLLRAVEAMLARLGRPLLLLLEDLQWADSESVALLAHLSRVVAQHPVLLVGTYRDDEAARLPAAIPGARVLKLHRLSQPSVVALSESILGPTGRRPELVTLLEKETEGNAFFLVEVLRALAEQAGGLSAVGSGPLPEQVFSGGVRAVLERRLNAVPLWARRGLRRCAVRGRRIDLPALPRFVSEPARFLQACAEAGVIEVADDAWHFSHDKLRERILEALAPAEAAALHRDVAEAMTWAYPNTSQHSAAIAEHYEQAGAPAQAAPHRVRAALLALGQGALEAAIRHSRAGLAAPAGALSALETAQAHKVLVHGLFGLRRIEECIAAFEQTTPSAQDQRFWHRIIDAKIRRITRQAAPVGRWLARRALRTQAPPNERGLARERFLTALMAAEAYIVHGDERRVPMMLLRNLALAEQADDAGLRAMSSASASFLSESAGLQRLSDLLLQRSERFLRGLRDPRAEIELLRMRGLLLIGRGELGRGEQQLARAQRRIEELGSEELRLFVAALWALSASLYGDCRRLRAQALALERAATPSQHPQYLVVGRLYRTLAGVREGELSDAAAALDAVEEQLRSSPVSNLYFCLWVYRAMLALRRAERAVAMRYAEQALEVLSHVPGYSPAHLHYFGALIEVCLGLAAPGGGGAAPAPAIDPAMEPTIELDRARFLDEAERVLVCLRQLVRRHPAGGARRWLYEGALAELRGKPDRARALFLRAWVLADRQQLPFELALSRRALGRLDCRAADPEAAGRGRAHLAAAALLFAKLGAHAEQAATQQLLAEPPPPGPRSAGGRGAAGFGPAFL